MTGLRPLRVAAAQAQSVSGDVPANVATAVSLVESAAREGARLVVLPELFLTGYDPDAWGKSPDPVVTVEDPPLQPLGEVARRWSVVVVAGLAETSGSRAFNGGSAVYDPEGRPVGRLGDESPAVVAADLDPNEAHRVREINPTGRDRPAGLGSRQRLVLAP